MRNHFVETAFVMTEREVSNIEWITHPVDRGCLPQHRAATAVDQAANELVLWIIVRCFRIFAHVESGKSTCTFDVPGVVRNRKTHAIEDSQSFAVMHPVRLSAELLVVHSIAARRNLSRSGLGVLPDHSLHTREIQLQDFIAPA